MKSATLTTNIHLGSDHIPVMAETQVYYALLAINATLGEWFEPKLPLNLCFVVDSSTSMKGQPIEMVRRVINALSKWLQPEDQISIVSFNDRAETIIPPTRILDMGNISVQISKIHPKGGTEIFQGLKRGYVQLIRAGNFKKSISHLILISDGQTYGDEEICRKLVLNMNQEGIIFSAVGIGDEWNDELLDELVGISGGEVRYSARAEQFPLEMESLIIKLQSKSIPGLSFGWQVGEGCQIKKIYRLDPDVMPLQIKDNTCCLGAISPDSTTHLLFELSIEPQLEPTTELAIFAANIKINSSFDELDIYSAPILVCAPVRKGAVGTVMPTNILVQALNMVTMYTMQDNARKLIRLGNVSEGVWILANVAKQLKSQGNVTLANRVETEVEFVNLHQNYSQGGEKTIKYSTRLLPAFRPVLTNRDETRKVE